MLKAQNARVEVYLKNHFNISVTEVRKSGRQMFLRIIPTPFKYKAGLQGMQLKVKMCAELLAAYSALSDVQSWSDHLLS